MNKIQEVLKCLGIKKIICIIACFVLVIAGILTLRYTLSNNDIQVFNNVELVDQELESITLTDIELKEEAGVYTYKAKVNASVDSELEYIRIIIKDESDKEIVTLIGYIGNKIEKDQSKTLEASTDADISNLKSIEYEVIK